MTFSKLWSDFDTETKVAQNTSNYPSCKSFFQMPVTDVGGATTTDSISGITLTRIGNFTSGANNSLVESVATPPTSDGKLPDLTSGYAVFIAVIAAIESHAAAHVGYGDFITVSTPYLGCLLYTSPSPRDRS